MNKNEDITGKIYFVRSGLEGPIKIGFTTKNPAVRIRELQTAHADKLFLLATAIGTLRDEALCHKRFEAYRMQGEWFRPSEALIGYIYPLPDIEIVYATLPIDLDETIGEVEKNYIKKAIVTAGGNIRKAATLLNIDYRSMRYRIDKYKQHWENEGINTKALKR